MWNTSVKIEYIAGLIVDALENYSVNRENAQFSLVMEELRNHFTNCSEQEITDIISLCMKMYSSKKIEHAELVLTAPDSFRVKTLRTKDTMRNMIENTEKSLTITGYKGTYKRNHEGDYHATEHEIRGMIRDQNPEGNDNQIIEYYTMDDIDKETLRKYRQIFEIRNDGHVWNALDDKSFLEKLGGYRKDRKTGVEGLTLAGLLMFGTGQAIRERFDNVFMDYRNESQVTADIRWNDRITYDGTWENNLFNFFTKVTPKLTEDLKKPFKLEGGVQRIDDTPVHKAVREGFVNMIIHADYLMDAGVLKVIKKFDSFEFTNPGILKLPLEDIYRGGNSKSRNPHMQTMLRLVGFGDNAGSGFPTILDVWKSEGWIKPEVSVGT